MERAQKVALCLDFDGTLSPIVEDPQAARPLPGQWASPIDQAARKIAGQYALKVIPGKLVWELRPPVRRDKGDAVRRVVAESGARDVVVVADDLGALPAFSAVAQLAGQGHKGLRVAVRSEEAPPQLLAEADLIIEGPAGVLDFLQQLAA